MQNILSTHQSFHKTNSSLVMSNINIVIYLHIMDCQGIMRSILRLTLRNSPRVRDMHNQFDKNRLDKNLRSHDHEK